MHPIPFPPTPNGYGGNEWEQMRHNPPGAMGTSWEWEQARHLGGLLLTAGAGVAAPKT
jgi:hypothetical protein